MDELLTRVFGQQGLLAFIVLALLLMIAEVGYRFGRRLYLANQDAQRSPIDVVQAAVLGMLGLLLGFTFSMAVDRYDGRRALVLKEANAIGTTWLRASLLPDAQREVVRSLLRDYVDLRLRAPAALRDPGVMMEGLRRSGEIHSELWQHAEVAGREAPNDMTATFVESLNDVIDTDAERRAASRSRIPSGVWLLLMVVAAVGCWTSAYGAGSHGVRSPLTSALLPVLVSVVILLIFDLTNERHGFISVSQQPLIDLQNAVR